MKNFKYLLAATVFLSINTWSSSTMPTSQICALTPATESCKELYDSFLLDLLHHVEADGATFDKQNYIEGKLADAESELSTLEKTHRSPIVQAEPSPMDLFWEWLASLFFYENDLEDADEEQAEVGGNLDYETDINDHKRQIAMYEEIQLTLPAIKKDSSFSKSNEYWSIDTGYYGVKSPEQLDAITLMLKYLNIDSLSVNLAQGFEETFYYDSLSQFQNNLYNSNALTSLDLNIKGVEYPNPISNLPDRLSQLLYSPFFSGKLAKKIISSRADPEKRKFERLSLSGLINMDEFLKNFYSYDDFFINFYSSLNLHALNYLNKYPQLDVLRLNGSGDIMNHQIGFLSKESLETLDGLLMRGLKELTFQYKIHQETTSEWPSGRLISALSELTHLRMDKALALKELQLEGIAEGDAALFVEYLIGTKNNLEKLYFGALHEVGRAELLNALTEIYSDKGGNSPMKSNIKLTSLTWSGSLIREDNIEPQVESHMSVFLESLAASAEAKKLHELEISGKGLTDHNVEALANGIKNKGYLCPSTIDFGFNEISISGAKILVDAIQAGCDKKVETLNLSGNFSHKAAKSIIDKYADYVRIQVY